LNSGARARFTRARASPDQTSGNGVAHSRPTHARSKGGNMIRRIAMSAMALVMAAGVSAAADGDGWNAELAASLSAQTGTTDSISGSIDATGERNWEKDEVDLRFSALYGTTRTRNKNKNDQTTQNNQGIFGAWKHTVHDRFFWETTDEISRDTVQDRLVRVAVDTGPGYRMWQGDDSAKEHFDLKAGIGYRFEMYDPTTVPGAPDRGSLDEDHFADIVGSFEYKNSLFDDKVEYTHTGSAKVPANDPDAYALRTEVILGVPLTSSWSFRASFLAEYLNDQPDEVNNTTTRATLGLGYKF